MGSPWPCTLDHLIHTAAISIRRIVPFEVRRQGVSCRRRSRSSNVRDCTVRAQFRKATSRLGSPSTHVACTILRLHILASCTQAIAVAVALPTFSSCVRWGKFDTQQYMRRANNNIAAYALVRCQSTVLRPQSRVVIRQHISTWHVSSTDTALVSHMSCVMTDV